MKSPVDDERLLRDLLRLEDILKIQAIRLAPAVERALLHLSGRMRVVLETRIAALAGARLRLQLK